MNRLKKLIFISLAASSLYADTLVIAVAENSPLGSVQIDEIRSLYLAKRFQLEDQKVIPLNLGLDNPLRIRFEQKILEKERDALARYWLKAHYLGHRPPKVFKSQESIAEFLSKVDDAIGYLEEETALKYRLKIIYREKE